MGLLAGIAALASPILARVLLALGMSVLSIVGASQVVDQVQSYVMGSLASGGGAAYMQIAGLAGAWVALGMVWGAVSFAVTYFGLTRAVRIVGVGASS